jgi:hypothetical protein
MATLVLQVAGAAIGSVFGPIGAAIGQAAGALAGSMVDRALFSSSKTLEGARLSTARIPGADEGEAITRLYGCARIGGTLIWATRYTEHVSVERSGGKGGGGGGGSTTVETFSYSANFALGLCEGEIATLRRVWADGQLLDLSRVTMRVYTGSRHQMPDPLIAAKQGGTGTPAFRGLAYVVFENFLLEDYGNRIPLMQFEVVRVTGGLEEQIRAVTPLSPVHVRARRVGGDMLITWIRRSRANGDDLSAAEIALDEPFERYRMTLSLGGNLLRRAEVDGPEFIYSAAMQSADGLAGEQFLTAQIEQMGRIIALGQPANLEFRI